jgi:hypothetical protein
MQPPARSAEQDKKQEKPKAAPVLTRASLLPLTNYSLSTVCPACNAPVIRRACKVRCERCGFMWDCSEL